MSIRLWTMAIIFILFILSLIVAGLYVDWLWFDSLGLSSVFATVFWTLNTSLSWRLSRQFETQYRRHQEGVWAAVAQIAERLTKNLVSIAVFFGGLFLALIMAIVASNQWDTILRYLNATPFQIA